MDPDQERFPATLRDFMDCLKHWRAVLQAGVEERAPWGGLKLEEESRELADLVSLDVELPGQYLPGRDVPAGSAVRLERVGSRVTVVRRHGSSHRRLTLLGSDGRQRLFLVQTSLPKDARSDERVLQLLRSLNRSLEKNSESRRRQLAFHTPAVVPVWPLVGAFARSLSLFAQAPGLPPLLLGRGLLTSICAPAVPARP